LALTILGNALPLLGVMLVGWDIYTLLIFYWCETVIFGFWTVVTIGLHRDSDIKALRHHDTQKEGGSAAAVILALHAGFFMAIHLFLMSSLYGTEWPGHLNSLGAFVGTFIIGQNLWPMLAGAFVQRALVFWEDHRANSVTPATAGLYLRIVVMQMVIIFGSWGVLMLGSGLFGLMLLVAMKTVLDLYWPRIIAFALRIAGMKPSHRRG